MKTKKQKRKINICRFPIIIIAILSSISTYSQTERQIVLDEMSLRPNDPWLRNDGHALLGEPGSPLAQKAYHEPGGSFSPSPISFGMAVWVMDSSDKLICTSDNIPIRGIGQQYFWKEGNRVPSIKTVTPYYDCMWTYEKPGVWKFEMLEKKGAQYKFLLVFRSVGPAGGPVDFISGSKDELLINHRWRIFFDSMPVSINIGDEQKGDLLTKSGLSNKSLVSPNGWVFAKVEIDKSFKSLIIKDTRPVFNSPLPYAKTVAQITVEMPDKRFKDALDAQIANLMMGYIGSQTHPGEPVNYPLAWERDGAYSLMAMAKSGNIHTARELAVYFAENDFFGGFGAEGDAPGSAIGALAEVALIIDEQEFYQWLWPHISRKLAIIDEMINAEDDIYKDYIGPLAPRLLNEDLKRRELIARKKVDGLINGTMDLHFPTLYINAVSYRGLIQASRLALKLNKKDISDQCLEKAKKIKAAWHQVFGQEKYDNERNFMIGVWPSWITNKDNSKYVEAFVGRRNALWSNGVPKNRPLWTYFNAAEAHQALFIEKPEITWETMHYFWNNQCSPGLYTYWEGDGEENSFGGWEKCRGWLKPKYITPHYWIASEMALLQLDMLVYFDESGDQPVLVVGGGVLKEWINDMMKVENFKTKFGTVSWYYEKNKMKVTVQGAKQKYEVKPGVSFNKNMVLDIEYK